MMMKLSAELGVDIGRVLDAGHDLLRALPPEMAVPEREALEEALRELEDWEDELLLAGFGKEKRTVE